MRIYIANDHTSVEMKNKIIEHLESKNFEIVDLGVNDGNSCNYASIGINLAEKVVNDKGSFGIALCGTGIGISIAANKVKHSRCALSYEIETAKLSRMHNNANIIATGARMIANEKAIAIIDAFLSTNFEGGRHKERVDTLNDYNEK